MIACRIESGDRQSFGTSMLPTEARVRPPLRGTMRLPRLSPANMLGRAEEGTGPAAALRCGSFTTSVVDSIAPRSELGTAGV